MTLTATRIFIFTFLPLLLAGGVVFFDKSANTRERHLEVVLIFLFGLGVTGSGIAGFIAHFFISDIVAESIGWGAGSPFQLEIAFANLATGLLGIIATGRRDGFREATVIAATTFSVGATIVHAMDILATGNLAPGNTLQNVSNLIRPALLIWALVAIRRVEVLPDAEFGTAEFDRWRLPLTEATAPLAIIVSTAFGLGFALGGAVPVTALGALIGAVIVAIFIIRSPYHDLKWR